MRRIIQITTLVATLSLPMASNASDAVMLLTSNWSALVQDDVISEFTANGDQSRAMAFSLRKSDKQFLVSLKDLSGHRFIANGPVPVRFSFAEGGNITIGGWAKGDTIVLNLPNAQVPYWTHLLTASSRVAIDLSSFGLQPWVFDLTGTSAATNAMAAAITAAGISDLPTPWDGSVNPWSNAVQGAKAGDFMRPQTRLPQQQASTARQPAGDVFPPTMPALQTVTAATPFENNTRSQSSSAEKIIARWSNSTDLTTRPFHVDGAWELQWTTDQGYFSITLHNANVPDKRELLANGSGAGISSAYHPTGGDFYLEFSGSQPWSARIVSIATDDVVAAASIAASPSQLMTQTPILTSNGLPADEAALIAAVEAARQQYQSAANDMAKGAARPVRARSICRAVRSPRFNGWTGTIKALSTNGEGKGVISIEIASGVQIETNNNSLSDIGDHTLIDPTSPLFQTASRLQPGQVVRFSGVLFQDDTDCFRETSMTMEGSITEPEFIMRLTGLQDVP